MVKVIWEKGRIAAAHGRFSCTRQVTPMCTPCKICFLGPIRVHRRFRRAHDCYVTDRPTDRPRDSVCNNGHIYARSTAMRPKSGLMCLSACRKSRKSPVTHSFHLFSLAFNVCWLLPTVNDSCNAPMFCMYRRTIHFYMMMTMMNHVDTGRTVDLA